jgi:4-hydroxyphenylpyruvate dioxygenase-like putative hemolysin
MNVEATWLKSNCFRVFLSQYRGDNNFKINSFEEYKKVQRENDYVAWTLLHNDDINHVAIQVEDIEDIIKNIRQDGTIMLNNENNPIEISTDGKLLQASTVADKIGYKFVNGEVHLVPYTFVEFIQRIDGREGFETRNAARIFTSTKL